MEGASTSQKMIRQSTYREDLVRPVRSRRSIKKFMQPPEKVAEFEYKELVSNKRELQFLPAASHRYNQIKNRYEDVLPLESTSVHLQLIPGLLGSDYINANYVTDRRFPKESKKQMYICSQAPVIPTFSDFWRMVWEQKCPIVVMLTNLIEKNRVKADMYWPGREGEVKMFGRMRVKLISQQMRGTVMMRRLTLWMVPMPVGGDSTDSAEPLTEESSIEYDVVTPVGTPPCEMSEECIEEEGCISFSSSSSDEEPPEDVEVRSCIQLHCEKWPDFGVLKSIHLLEDLIREIEVNKKSLKDPILVHCSAGIGRTGTLIAILTSLHREILGERIDIRGTVEYLRTRRLGMVQSTAQYKFIYQIVADLLVLREQFCHPAARTILQGVWYNQDRRKRKSSLQESAEGKKDSALMEAKADLQSSIFLLDRFRKLVLRKRSQYVNLGVRDMERKQYWGTARSWHGRPSELTNALTPDRLRSLRRRSEGRKGKKY